VRQDLEFRSPGVRIQNSEFRIQEWWMIRESPVDLCTLAF
jgi:hypothetical protein